MSSAVDTQITKEVKLKDTFFSSVLRRIWHGGSVMSVFCNGGAAAPTTAALSTVLTCPGCTPLWPNQNQNQKYIVNPEGNYNDGWDGL